MAFIIKYIRKVSNLGCESEDLEVMKICILNAEGGNLPPPSSSICDKIFRGFYEFFLLFNVRKYGLNVRTDNLRTV
jgi:hypothetical protein